MGVSVVIVSYRPDWLARSIASVIEQADEVVVVDNASGGAQASEIARAGGARPVRLEENRGFSGGANAGIAAARHDHVALLNDDAFAEPGWLASAVEVLADDTIAAVGPKLRFAWPYAIIRLDDPVHFAPADPRPLGRRLSSLTIGGRDVWRDIHGWGLYPDEGGWRWTDGAAELHLEVQGDDATVEIDGERVEPAGMFWKLNNAGSYLTTTGEGGDIGFLEHDDGRFDGPADRFAVCGAAMVARAETLHRLGVFAEDFFTYYEDTDWCWRARLAGYRLRYDPQGVVRHVHAATSGEWSPRFRYYVARNRLLCLTRNAPARVVAQVGARALRGLPKGVAASLARRLPEAAVERQRLRRLWVRTPEAVWDEWAGRDAPVRRA
jgi:O-antigen biosynthesis protein